MKNSIFIFLIIKNTMNHISMQNNGEYSAIFSIRTGLLVEGKLPHKKLKYVIEWAEIHKEELMNNWALSFEGNAVSKIDPLR